MSAAAGAGSGGGGGGRGADEEPKLAADPLGEKLIMLVKKQKVASDEFNALLNKKDGLKNNTRLTVKNLEVAVVQSKRPGYFHYHKPSEEVQRIEREGLLVKKSKEIQALQAQIDAVNEEIKKRHEAEKVAKPPSCNTLKQFFSEFGRPDPVQFEPLRTEFRPSPKVYGGSKHYQSFKSISVDMKRGRVTG